MSNQLRIQKESTMSVKRIASAVLAGCAAVVISTTSGVAAQMPAMVKPAPAQMKMPAAMEAKCQAMMVEHDKMMADMKVADQRLDGLVTNMNAAKGMDQPIATAAVVTEMVKQHQAMRDAMMKSDHDMMTHMMEHMQAGTDSMASCPMMKKMGGI
jgi:hypothetical protein